MLAFQTVLYCCIGYVEKGVLNSHFWSNTDLCYIQNSVITNRVIKRFRCITKYPPYLSHVMRKPVYAICDQQRRRSYLASASLISAFVVHCLDSIIPLVSISKISSLCLASVAAHACLSLPLTQTRRQVSLWRGSNYPLIITKYPPYLFYCLTEFFGSLRQLQTLNSKDGWMI